MNAMLENAIILFEFIFLSMRSAHSEFFTERTFLSVIDNLHSIYKSGSSKLTEIT